MLFSHFSIYSSDDWIASGHFVFGLQEKHNLSQYVGIVPIYVSNEQTNLKKKIGSLWYLLLVTERTLEILRKGRQGFYPYEIKIRSLTTLEFKSNGKWRNGYYINNRKITVLSKLLGNQISRTMLRN